MLTKSEIDEILRLVDGSQFNELKLEMGDLKLELRKGAPLAAAPVSAAAPVAAPVPAVAPQAPVAQPATVSAHVVASGGGSEVPAPLLGTFWHAPRPGADPFVKPGDLVEADTVIGIIEVMKLMNSVSAGVAGRVTQIVAKNGELVEHGQALIKVEPV